MNAAEHTVDHRVAALEARFGLRLTARLSESSDQLPHDVTERLRHARQLALAQALWHGKLIRKRERDDCFRAFRINHWLGFTVFVGIVLSYALAGL